MTNELRVKLVRIGNSRGVRLPRAVLDQVGLDGEALLSVRDGAIVLSPCKRPRAGWEQALLEHGPPDDADPEFLALPNRFDDEEWTW